MSFQEAKNFAERHNFTMKTETPITEDGKYIFFEVEKGWTFFFTIDDNNEFEPIETEDLKEDYPYFFSNESFVPHTPKK